jgi:hypothetical protein
MSGEWATWRFGDLEDWSPGNSEEITCDSNSKFWVLSTEYSVLSAEFQVRFVLPTILSPLRMPTAH